MVPLSACATDTAPTSAASVHEAETLILDT